MLWQILRFEIRYWLRSWMLWIFLLIIAALIFAAASTDQVRIGDSFLNTYRNAPFVIENFYSFVGLFMLLMTPAFVNSAAARDFSYRTYEIIFSTPLRRRDYLWGRFIGATVVATVPALGVSIGILLAKYMPWVDADRWGPVNWMAHVQGIVVFAVPNAVFIAAVLFAIAVLARNEIAPFIGGLVLLTGYAVADALTQNLEREKLAAMLDPFAIRTFSVATKYWTVAEKNTRTIGFDGMLLWNRLLWLAVGGLVFAFAYSRFSFAEKRKKVKAVPERESAFETSRTLVLMPPAATVSRWPQFWASVRVQFLGVVKSTSFIVILAAALLNSIPSIAMSAREAFDGVSYPVTYWVLEIISGTLYMFLVGMITFYAGVLVWKDRDTRMDEIHDALPVPDWLSYVSRLTALVSIVLLVELVAMASGVVVQTWLGYHRYQFGLYLKEMFVRDGSFFVFSAVLAFFIHALSPNKYVGYFGFITFLVLNAFIWRPLNVATNLVRFGMRPSVTYSDFFGDAPFRAGWDWFTLYWLLVLRAAFDRRGAVLAARQAGALAGAGTRGGTAFSRRIAADGAGVRGVVYLDRRLDRIQHHGPKPAVRTDRSAAAAGRLREDIQAPGQTAPAAGAQREIRDRDLPGNAQHDHARQGGDLQSLPETAGRNPLYAEPQLPHADRRAGRGVEEGRRAAGIPGLPVYGPAPARREPHHEASPWKAARAGSRTP